MRSFLDYIRVPFYENKRVSAKGSPSNEINLNVSGIEKKLYLHLVKR